MIEKFKNAIIKAKNKYQCSLERKKLKHTDFCIISNNCWGGFIYQKFGIKYNTPTIGLFIYERDYIKFCSNLKYYFSLPLQFIKTEESKYYDKVTNNGSKEISYPIAKLDDIEVFFMHYNSEKEAVDKWKRRKQRINYDNLLFKMSERNDSNFEIIKAFANLPYKNKICFTENQYDFDCCVKVEEFQELNKLGGDETPYTLEKIDIYNLINKIK